MKQIKILAIVVVIAGMASQINAQLDTTGIGSWKMMYNSMASWEEGAFAAHATGHPDYGWGIYNNLTHGLTGDSIYVIKLQDGSYKKFWIVEKTGSSVYKFRHADLDGENESDAMLDMTSYTDKHFVYYNLRADSIADVQPAAESWDIMLTKFTLTKPFVYTVTGFQSNDGVTVSVFNAADSATAADATLADTTEFSDSISAIGNSWSKLQGMSIMPIDTIAYFIRTGNGEIYKMQTIFFESGLFGGSGRVGIRTQHFVGESPGEWILDTLVMGADYANEVYYSMSDGTVESIGRDVWDIGFKSGIFTSSISANTAMGVELYTYPNGDTSAWYGATAIQPQTITDENLSLYPIPAGDQLTVRFGFNTKEILEISVYDLTGKQLKQINGIDPATREYRFETSGLKPGVYMLRLGNREVQAVRKFSVR